MGTNSECRSDPRLVTGIVCVFVCVCVNVSVMNVCVWMVIVSLCMHVHAHTCVYLVVHPRAYMTESPTSESLHNKNERRDEGSRGDNC